VVKGVNKRENFSLDFVSFLKINPNLQKILKED